MNTYEQSVYNNVVELADLDVSKCNTELLEWLVCASINHENLNDVLRQSYLIAKLLKEDK